MGTIRGFGVKGQLSRSGLRVWGLMVFGDGA